MSKNFTFNNAPAIQMRRSRIGGLSYGVNSSYSMGRVYPCYVEEVLPGDTFKVKSDMVARLSSSFIKPIYGNLFVDVFYFFVPWRLVYDDFPCIFGENKESAWKRTVEKFAPTTPANQTVVSKSIADYLEMPLGTCSDPINILYHRANALVWNEWFRDENYQDPVYIYKGDFDPNETLNGNEWSPKNYTGLCPPINKYRDYFTSVLRAPQKGDPVAINVANGGYYPVYAQAENNPIPNERNSLRIYGTTGVFDPNITDATGFNLGFNVANSTSRTATVVGSPTFDGSILQSNPVAPLNLGVNLGEASSISVNDLRLAFQTQKILERDALGTRYVEHILNTFGVTNPDARLQRPELLNASRFPLNIQQVASTNSTADKTLAQLGAYSLSKGKGGFSKAFSEYGCIIGYVAIRQFHSYQQGLPKRYTRRKRLDYFNPALAYIGMMPVKSTEIYASADPADIFGYQRAWSEYRHHQNVVSGQMRSAADNTLDIWTIADDYANQPVSSDEFIRETPLFLDNAITISHTEQDQFIFDIWHDVDAIRVMPANPMPGLIDHY